MKWQYWVSTILLSLTVGIVGWLCIELNLVGSSESIAADSAPVANAELSQEYDVREKVLQEKERGLKDREGILKERAGNYEKSLSELAKKYKDREAIEKKKYEEKEAQFKAKLAQKDAEIKSLKDEMSKVVDRRVLAFKSVYEKMEAKKAAKVLEEMDITLANQILTDMKQERAADILGKMPAEKARLITEKTLGKRKIATTNSSKEEGQ